MQESEKERLGRTWMREADAEIKRCHRRCRDSSLNEGCQMIAGAFESLTHTPHAGCMQTLHVCTHLTVGSGPSAGASCYCLCLPPLPLPPPSTVSRTFPCSP